MQNKKLIVLVVLGAASVFSLVYGIVTPSKVRREISKESTGSKSQITVTAGIKSTRGTRGPRRTGFSSWGRDPFSSGPEVFSPTNIADMNLTGILWDESVPLAMINDNPVGVGDKIAEYTVLEIKKDSVTLTDGTDNYRLTLPY